MQFSGSYKDTDVTFLLKSISLPSTDIQDKEKLMQSEKMHYSEMITYEKPPSKEYMGIFYDAWTLNGNTFSQHVYHLAKKINDDFVGQEVVIVSLARAGTPVGVIVHNVLQEFFQRKSFHYSVSIIRDRGLDLNALEHIVSLHEGKDIVFIDGWTGKGVIGKELKQSVEVFNAEHIKGANDGKSFTPVNHHLYVVADISGTAYWSATANDYLIPSAVLNSTISGLVSRTILHNAYISDNDFHGCLYYDALTKHDISKWFVNMALNKIRCMDFSQIALNEEHNTIDEKTKRQQLSRQTIEQYLNENGLSNQNFVKPGIGESTRVLLRRSPKTIILKDKNDTYVKHLVYLAQQKNIPIIENPQLCYNAVAIIEVVD